MDEGIAGLAGLHGRIADVRRQFFAEREKLEQSLSLAFDDPASASDVLLSLAEEYGPEGAVALLRERPFDVGELRPDPDIADTLEGQLSDIMQTQDWLDDLTAEREKLAPTQETGKVLSIQGDDYCVSRREARLLEVAPEHAGLLQSTDLGQSLPQAEPRQQEQDVSRRR